jgi:hypothetical protein
MQSRWASPSPAAAGCRGAAAGNNLNSPSDLLSQMIGIDMFILRRLTICGADAQYL